MTDGEFLTGSYHIRKNRACLREIGKLFELNRDKKIFWRQLLKLRYWPEKNIQNEQGQHLGIDWSPIKALPNKNVCELRIDEEIGGCDNLRAAFFIADLRNGDPLPIIWILSVLQKKRNDFTAQQINVFDARRHLVQKRYYELH